MRIIIYTVFLLLFCIIVYKNQKLYEKYINENYITVKANCGLCNKLGVVLSYLYKANQEGKKLRVIWTVYKYCPDRFINLFENIENVEIIEIFEIFKKRNEHIDIEYDNMTCNGLKNNYIKDEYYKLLKPLPDIQLAIDETIKLLGNTYIACHIRRTDRKKEAIDDKEYIKFINSYPLDLKIYIATDCRDTQQTFIDLYPDRLIYKKIEDNNNFRQTSLQDAVKDIYVCAGATYFMRSAGTFSYTIINLRNLKN